MALPARMKFGIFLAPFHRLGEDPTLGLERDLELLQWLDYLGFDEAWIGEHHSGGWETIASPEVFMATAAERTKHIKLGTGVISLAYHHPLMVANRMVLLDHLTRGRVMMGVGPGALSPDAVMLGVDVVSQRQRMHESLDIIMRLLTETEPITYEADWFQLHDALLHLRPYTQPHFPIAVAASGSPSGMELAGKHGLWVLSVSSVNPQGKMTTDLNKFWQIAEESAAKYGQSVSRDEWRLVLHVHLAESRQEAIEQVREGAAAFQHSYFEQTLGMGALTDGPPETIVEAANEQDVWCVGTPDDLVAKIKRLGEVSGGFGGLLLLAHEWATREQTLHSYELLSRYVKPQFQGSLVNLTNSQAWATDKLAEIKAKQQQAMDRAKRDYLTRR